MTHVDCFEVYLLLQAPFVVLKVQEVFCIVDHLS